MMATAGPESGSSLLPLLESLEDGAAGQPEQTDVYLTIANRLSGEEGRQFLPAVEKHFPRLGKAILTHITGSNPELSQAALQALGFCVYHANVVSGVSENFVAEILSALCSLVVTSTDKNSCTRALWVISKQSFPSEVMAKKVDNILDMLERLMTREDIQSVVMEHEALNVVIRLLEQAPAQMSVGAVRWSKMVIPMVVHSATKVRLRAAAAMELGLPLLLERQNEVAAIIEPLMSTKLAPELQKLFSSKNEVNVLKLWPLFVKLLGKYLHRGGPLINSLLHLEELGFRSSSPNVKKIAFIAWKSLIDNFALNPEILCSTKRMKLLLQPLLSIHVRTESLQLSRLEVWWYLVVRLGPNLGPHFEQVSVPLLQRTIGGDSTSSSTPQPGTPARGIGQSGTLGPSTPKTGTPTSFNTPRMTLNNNNNNNDNNRSLLACQGFPTIQLLGLEMLLHYFLGPEVVTTAAKINLQLTLEPLTHPFLSGGSALTKYAALFISSTKDALMAVGADAPDSLLAIVWKSLVGLVSSTVESGSSKKERQGSEVLTLMLQALQDLVSSEALPASRVLVLFEITVKGIPSRVLGSAAYQVGKMDVLNGTPALFLILQLYNSNMLSAYAEDERFFQCLNTLVGCGLGGPTSSLAFGEAVLGAVGRSAASVANKEYLWRMWSAVVTPLTDTITQSNEVNQGDALEHNFGAVHSSLMFPVTHLLLGAPLHQMTQKSLLLTWSKLYRVFARCSALVPTAEENIGLEELCVKMAAVLDADALAGPAALDAICSILQVMVECVDFSPYTPHFQQKTKSPRTPINWTRKRSQALGNLAAFQALLGQTLEAFLAAESPAESTGPALVSILSTLFSSLAQATPLQAALGSLAPSLAILYRRASPGDTPAFSSQLVAKLEKLLVELLCCLQSRSTMAYDDQLLAYLAPLLCVTFQHKNRQLRAQATHFWNATFAKSSSLTYPEELKPVLSQLKRNTPIILPGFDAVTLSDEHSGPYSSECSQLETKLSGVQVFSAGKRDSLLGRAAELKDRSSKTLSKPVSQTKLDFGSPKPPRRGVLEEEASIDFVFIPPENKERVLTEHQKEVKRTKRGDIPAMYNTLDASLDTTAFTQYSQSQDDSTEKLCTEQANSPEKESAIKVDEMEVEEESDIIYKDTEDFSSPEATKNDNPVDIEQEECILDSTGQSMQDAHTDAATEDAEPKEEASADVSGSSDLVSGTPQKPNSRRQSFITLEKYAEGKAASPVQVTKFTGPLACTAKASPAQAATSSPSGDQPKQSETPQPAESSSPPGSADSHKMSSKPEAKPAKRHSSGGTEDEEDVILDTQTTSSTGNAQTKKELDSGAIQEEQETDCQETEESDGTQDDSQNSQGTPDRSYRRSGRCRVPPRLPGQHPEDWEKYSTRPAGNQESPSIGGRRERSSAAKEKLRTSALKDKDKLPQTDSPARQSLKKRLYSHSQDVLGSEEEKPRRRSTRGGDLSQTGSQTDMHADTDSQSQGRRSSRRKGPATEPEKPARPKQKGRGSAGEKRESRSQNASQSQETPDTKVTVLSDSEFEPGRLGGEDEAKASLSTTEAATPEMSVAQAATPKTPVPEETTPEMPASAEATPETAASEAVAPEKPLPGAATPASAEAKPETPASEADAPKETTLETPASEAATPETPASEAATPEAPASEAATPEAPVSEAATPEAPASEAATPEVPAPDETTPETPASEAATQSSPPKGISGRSSTVVGNSLGSSADSISQEDSQVLTPSSSGSQLQSKLRQRSKAPSRSLAPADKLNAESQVTPSAVRPRTRRSIAAKEELSQTSSSSQDESTGQPSAGLSRYSRRRCSPALLANQETSESDSSENRESPAPKKRSKIPVSPPVASPLTVQNAPMGSASETSQMDPLQGIPDTSPFKTATRVETVELQKEAFILVSRAPLAFEKQVQQSEADANMQVVLSPIVALEPLPENVETENSKAIAPNEDMKCMQSPVAPYEKDHKPMLSQAKLNPSDQGSLEYGATDTKTEPSQEGLVSSGPSVPTAPSNTTSSNEENDLFSETTDLSSPRADSSSTPTSSGEATANLSLQVSDSSEEKVQHMAQPAQEEEAIAEELQADSSEPSQVLAEGKDNEDGEDANVVPSKRDEGEAQSTLDEPVVEEEVGQTISMEVQAGSAEGKTSAQEEGRAAQAIPSQEAEKEEEDTSPAMDCEEDEDTQIDKDEAETPTLAPVDSLASGRTAMLPSALATKEDYQASPTKLRTPEVLTGLETAQSPSSRTRGTWSPSASPSSSILKKAQKRALEEDAISPLVKSRRVSFANPIQHQELADDIDRRSPVIRTSSPKRVKTNSSIPQPKYVTTPTKGLLVLSPRNLHSSGYKSSKKCLMSEMSQEPRAIPKDCIFPALVCCSAPIEAVLPLISTNMWPRGFGQLVRAKNIKTVGDLSSLKPGDLKVLPIRSPKISNVKKALRLYEQQRKMRGSGDELKSFEEMEKMISSSEPAETNTSLNQDEDDKTHHEPLATELVDEPVCGDQSPQRESAPAETETCQMKEEMEEMEEMEDLVEQEQQEQQEEEEEAAAAAARPTAEQAPSGWPPLGGLLSQVDLLSSGAGAEEMGLCTAEQLVQLHDALAGGMRRVMLELQSRLCHADGTRR